MFPFLLIASPAKADADCEKEDAQTCGTCAGWSYRLKAGSDGLPEKFECLKETCLAHLHDQCAALLLKKIQDGMTPGSTRLANCIVRPRKDDYIGYSAVRKDQAARAAPPSSTARKVKTKTVTPEAVSAAENAGNFRNYITNLVCYGSAN